ncbi:MAG TPA: DUF6152 family protein [Bryobacteraceae bacterium]|nr:DUF6152 family protein [Bryobacteraceae bacterium]
MKRKLIIFTVSLGLAGTGTALAHHSFAAEFDGNKPIRIEGSLSKVEWMNPHSYFYVDVSDGKGTPVTWGCEGANPGVLSRQGFRKGDVKLGDQLVVDGYAAKDGAHLMNVRRIYLNGKLIFDGSGEGQQ